MPQEEKPKFCQTIQRYDIVLSKYNCKIERPVEFLYYHRIGSMLFSTDITTVGGYDSLSRVVRRTCPFRNSERFIEAIKHTSYASDDVWKLFPFLDFITKVSAPDSPSPNLRTKFPSCTFKLDVVYV